MKKIIYILLYFYITSLLPSGGTSSFFFETNFVWLQKLVFSLLGILLFYSELKFSLKKITVKSMIIFAVMPSILIYLFYVLLLLLLIINQEVNFESNGQLSSLSIITYVILAPFVEELVYRYSFTVSSNNQVIRSFVLVIASLIFTYGHAAEVSYHVIYLIPFLFMAFTLSAIYMMKKNIWYCIICHSSYNLIVIVLNDLYT